MRQAESVRSNVIYLNNIINTGSQSFYATKNFWLILLQEIALNRVLHAHDIYNTK